MNDTINCKRFDELVQPYLDNELDPAIRRAVEEHAKSCMDCARALDDVTRIMTACAEMDEGLIMPLDAQAAWRRAVRDEAAKRRKRGALSWAKSGGLAVAALAVLIGGAAMLQNGQNPLSLMQTSQQTDVPLAIARTDYGDFGGYPTADAYDDGASAKNRRLLADGAVENEPAMAGAGSLGNTAGDIVPMVPPTEVEPGVDPDVPAAQIRVIRTASRDIETFEMDSDLLALKDLVSEYDGLIEYESVYGMKIDETHKEGRYANLTLRIPTAQLDEFLVSLDAIGTTTARSENSEDISMQYFDTKTRLESQKAFRQKLTDMIPQAQTVEEMISIQQQLSYVQGDIEAMEGTIKGWDSQINYSSVNVSVQEVADKNAVKTIDTATLGSRIKTGFYASINAFSSFLQNMLVFLVLVWPWLLLLIAILLIVRAVVRRRKRS